ncbi:response regulator, partial [Candidatus Pseudoscillospira sp. SGI.172]|uniref:response regulator n=1 Tax=Candidatus Pseudoscillospira sp. SGI.172 TaxID=3420582 RepID=UPI003D002888
MAALAGLPASQLCGGFFRTFFPAAGLAWQELCGKTAAEGTEGRLTDYTILPGQRVRMRCYQPAPGSCACCLEVDGEEPDQNQPGAADGGTAVYRVGERPELIYISPGAAALTGHTPKEYQCLAKEDALFSCWPGERETAESFLMDACGEEPPHTGAVLWLRHRNGTPVWVQARGRVIGTDGKAPLLQFNFRNVALPNKMKQNILTHQVIFDLAVNSEDVIVWTYNPATHTLYETESSRAVHPGTAMETPDFVEQSIRSGVVKAESVDAFRELYRRVEAGEPEVSGDIWFARRDGSGWWCERIWYTNLLDDKGNCSLSIGVGKNITDVLRNKAERQQMEMALSFTSIVLCSYNVKRDVFTSFSPGAERIGLGTRPGEGYMDRVKRGYVMPDSVQDYIHLYQALGRGEKTASAVIHYDPAKTSGIEWLKLNYSAIYDSKGHVEMGVAVGEDITELMCARRKFEWEKRELEGLQSDTLLSKYKINLTKNTLENCMHSDRLIPLRPENGYTEWVESAAVRGETQEMRDALRWKLSPQNLTWLHEMGAGPLQAEYRLQMADGRYSWVRTTVRCEKDPETGDLMGFMSTCDINGEKQMEMIINRILDLHFEFLGLLDLSTQQITNYHHSKLGAPLGSSRDVDYFKDVSDFVERFLPPELRKDAFTAFSIPQLCQALADQDSHSIVFPACEQSVRRIKKWQYMYLDQSRTVIVVIRTDITDITLEQERQQQALREALIQAKQASRAKTQFLSRMSHELRTPMNTIIGMSEVAAHTLNDPKRAGACLDKVKMSAHLLLALINDILDMSRIESGKVLLKSEEFNFRSFLRGVNDIALELAEEKGVAYTCLQVGFLEETYGGDVLKLQQILLNLLSNAIKFTPQGGKVQLLVFQKEAEKEGKARMCFTVSDTGVGIEEAFLPKLFEPFEQEGPKRTGTCGGTGLGLAICKCFVEMMDGTIGVSSIEGVGSKFTVEVTLSSGMKALRRANQAGKKCWDGFSALVADDEAVICEQAVGLLSQLGFQTECVASGFDALKKVELRGGQGKPYDLILMDWQMPGMNGQEAARRIRPITGSGTAILLMTAYDRDDLAEESWESGIDQVITKPIFKATLGMALEQFYLRKERERQECGPRKYDFRDRRILLVEDHALNAEVASRLLAMKGCTVERAKNGVEAIEAITLSPPGFFDAVLMDVVMPVMDGLTAARAIRQLKKEKAQTVPILGMSANVFEENEEKSREAGMNLFLSKPIDPEVLYQALEHCFRGEDRER